MFALTESAVSAIQKLAGASAADGAHPPARAVGGLRIAAGTLPAGVADTVPGARALRLTFVDAPQPGDRVHDAAGARLFVAPGLAGYLDGKALDADIDNTGEVCFSVARQPATQPG